MQSCGRPTRHATAIVGDDAHHSGSGAIRFSPGWRPRTAVGFDVPCTAVLVHLRLRSAASRRSAAHPISLGSHRGKETPATMEAPVTSKPERSFNVIRTFTDDRG